MHSIIDTTSSILDSNSISLDTVVSIVTTVMIFILGIFANIIYEYIRRKIKNKKTRKYFKFLINDLVDSFLTSYWKILKEFIYQLNVDSGLTTSPPEVTTGNFQRIKNIDNEDLFDSFNDKITLSKILSYADFVIQIVPNIRDFHEAALKSSTLIRDDLQKAHNHWFESLVGLLEHLKNELDNYQEDVTYQFLNEKIVFYYEKLAQTRNLNKFYLDIVRPIQEYLIRTNLFRTNDYYSGLAENGRKLSSQFVILKISVTETKTQYKEFLKSILKARLGLRKQLELMKLRD